MYLPERQGVSMLLTHWISPAMLMRICAAVAALGIAVMAVMTPALFDAVVRGGEPMAELSRVRLDFLRLALGILAAAGFCFCLARRSAADLRPFRQLVFAIPLAALVVVVLYKVVFGSADARYMWFIREDGPVEYATALFYLIGTLVAGRAAMLARDAQTRLFLALFTFGMLFIALSEVSFGQRIIGLKTPEALQAINKQQEISVHNIYGIQFVVYAVMPLVILAYAIFGRAIAGAVANSRAGRHVSRDLLAVGSAPWYSATFFVPMAVFCVKQLTVEGAVFKDQEPAELFMAVGFLLVALRAWAVLAEAAAAAPESRPGAPETTVAHVSLDRRPSEDSAGSAAR